jgi:hypothetical protein
VQQRKKEDVKSMALFPHAAAAYAHLHSIFSQFEKKRTSICARPLRDFADFSYDSSSLPKETLNWRGKTAESKGG